MRNPNRIFKGAIYEQFAPIGKAVSGPKRLELLDLLCQAEGIFRPNGYFVYN